MSDSSSASSRSPPTKKRHRRSESPAERLYVPVRERRRQRIEQLVRSKATSTSRRRRPDDVEQCDDNLHTAEPQEGVHTGHSASAGPRADVSLLDQHTELKQQAARVRETETQKQLREEEQLLESVAERRALMGVGEIAQGIQYSESLKTSWTPPRYLLDMPAARHDRLRRRQGILVEGVDPPPPIKHFAEMKLGRSVIKALRAKGKPDELFF